MTQHSMRKCLPFCKLVSSVEVLDIFNKHLDRWRVDLRQIKHNFNWVYAGVADPDPTTAVWIPRLDPQFFELERNFFLINNCQWKCKMLLSLSFTHLSLNLQKWKVYVCFSTIYMQGCGPGSGTGSGSVLDPYSIESVDPDPYSESGSGSRRAKMTHKSRQ